jgi:hypothetical protein
MRPRFLNAHLSTRAHYECAIVSIDAPGLALRTVACGLGDMDVRESLSMTRVRYEPPRFASRTCFPQKADAPHPGVPTCVMASQDEDSSLAPCVSRASRL